MIYSADLLNYLPATLHGGQLPQRLTGFSHNSNLVKEGNVFVALRTDRGDGHDFINEAAAAGASVVICDRLVTSSIPALLVEDVRTSLQNYAKHVLSSFGPRVIAVGGSVGKTTTREISTHVLTRHYDVFQNPENYNDLFGLPIALGHLDPGHEFAILEMASDSHGELGELLQIAPPEIVILTNFDQTYLEFFGDMKSIEREHYSLISSLNENSLLIYPFGDALANRLAKQHNGPKYTYGLSDAADFTASNLDWSHAGSSFLLSGPNEDYTVNLPLPGEQHVKASLAAAALAEHLGIAGEDFASALGSCLPIPGRFNHLTGIGGVSLFDDSFSTSPESMRLAMKHLSKLETHPICVLAEFENLGPSTNTIIDQLAPLIADTAHDVIAFGDGDTISQLVHSLKVAGFNADHIHRTHTHEHTAALAQELSNNQHPIYLKGGSTSRLEKVTELLLESPGDASHMLCRQSILWRQLVTVNPDAPVWIQIDLDAITQNVQRLIEIIGPDVKLYAVLKAEAYGHGAARIASTAQQAGAYGACVARINEGRQLRLDGFDGPILVLGATPPADSRNAVLSKCSIAVYDRRGISALNRAAQSLDKSVAVHLKIDTGMGRLGCSVEDAAQLAQLVHHSTHLTLEGTFTHLARADDNDKSHSLGQLERFKVALNDIKAQNISPGIVHAANSAGTLSITESHFNAVRCGIALLGLAPNTDCALPTGFEPVLTFKARIVQVKHLNKGDTVGYGTSGILTKESTIAIVGAGYGDGFRRGPHPWGPVTVRGRSANIVGKVCMDMFMIDISSIDGARVGDEVTLIGPSLTASRAGERSGTTHYELISQLLPRVPRI